MSAQAVLEAPIEVAPRASQDAHSVLPGRRLWLWLIGVAAAARALFAFGVLGSMPLVSDADAYGQQAAAMVHGTAAGAYYWPPGTSYLLAGGYAIFGVHEWVAHLLMVLLGVVSVVTTTLIAARVLRDRRAVIFTGFIVALAPEMAIMAAQPYSLELTLVGVNLTILGALYAHDTGRMRWYALAGVGLGIGALARMSTLSLLLPLAVAAIVIVLRRRREGGQRGELGRLVAGAALLLLCTAALLYPAARHNHAAGAGWTVAVNGEINTWLGNNPYTPDYKTWWLAQHETADFPPATQAYLKRFQIAIPPTRAQRTQVRDEARRYMLGHPGVTALRTVNRVRAFWGFPYTVANTVKAFWGKSKLSFALVALGAAGYVLFALLAIAGLVFARANFRRRRMTFVLGAVLAFQVPYAIVFAAGHWHYPVLGLVAPLAGAGLAWLYESRARFRTLLHSPVFLIAAALFLAIQAEYAYFVLAS